MHRIQIKDKFFELFIPETEILKAVENMAAAITSDMKEKDLLFVCVLNGSFMFASDLIKNIKTPCNISFIRLQSYEGVNTEGKVKEIQGLTENIAGRNIIIIEDIIDTGHTMNHLLKLMQDKKPQSIRIATLLFKPSALQMDVKPDYVALTIPNDFVVGYGLDYDGYGRNLKDIYKVKD